MAIQKIPDKMLGFNLVENSQSWISSANQSVFNITNGSYLVGAKRISVYIGGIKQVSGEHFFETTSTAFTLSESLPAGVKVEAVWFEMPVIQPTTAHAASHRVGGYDELNIKDLVGYDNFAVKTNNIITVEQYGAVGDGVTPDDTAFAQAILNANGRKIQLQNKTYLLTKTLTIGTKTLIQSNDIDIEGSGGHAKTTIIFNVTTADTPLILLSEYSTKSTFKNITFIDKSNNGLGKIGVGIKIVGASNIAGDTRTPNWKNYFEKIEILNFKTAVIFGGLNVLIGQNEYQNYSSENLFLHCRFRNNLVGVLSQNQQAFNNAFIQCDIENTDTNEQYTLIRDEAGGAITFTECSLIGAGRIYEWIVPVGSNNTFTEGALNLEHCRIEIHPSHIGQLFYQDITGQYNTNSSVFIKVQNTNIFIQNSQTLDLMKYCGRVVAKFDGITVNGGQLNIRNFPVAGISAASDTGSQGIVTVSRSNNIGYILDTGSDYGTTSRQFAHKVVIEKSVPKTSRSFIQDSYGFYSLVSYDIEEPGYKLSLSTPKRLVWNDSLETNGFKSVMAILPARARMTKFGIWKQPVHFTDAIQYKLYIVKDVAAWATTGTFNVSTDAYLVADTGSTVNKAGLFEVPVQLTTNSLGYRMESGFGTNWTEGRIYIEHSGSTSYFAGFVYVEYM